MTPLDETPLDAAPRNGTTFDRLGSWFARRGWAHLTLFSGIILFLFPFLWMIGLSTKTDEEAVNTSLMPAIPTFCAASPVIRPVEPPERPIDISKENWNALLPILIHQTRAAIDPLTLPAGGDAVDAAALRQAAAQSLSSALVEQLPERKWSGDSASFQLACRALLTPQTLADALDNQLGRLNFFSLQIHSLDSHIFTIGSGAEIARQWKVESGPGKLLTNGDQATYLRYRFSSPSDAPVILRTDFDAHIPADQLHKLVIAMQGDDSWNQLDITLDLGNQHWASDSTTYIAQYRSSSITFQPPGFDDTTYRPRTWVSLVPVPASQSTHQTLNRLGQSPTAATLRLILRPSSTPTAILGKIQRNYLRAFRAIPFWTYVGNSVLLVALQMAGALLSAAFVAYAFARLHWPGRSFAFGLLLATMMLPSQVTMIPSFIIWRSLGWFNTLNPLWVPAWFGSGFFIFLMTQNMKTIPRELEEAARIDGLSALQTWWYIILPLVKPTLAAIAIMVFMGAWNDFMGPLIMLRDQSRYPLSLGLFGLHVDQTSDSTLIMAGNMLMTFPVILIFFIFQKYFIEGVSVSGMKG